MEYTYNRKETERRIPKLADGENFDSNQNTEYGIILLRYLFTWYFQRQLNKNSKNLTALKAEKKKILEQVMDKETYKVAVNLLARFGDKPTKLVLTTSTSSSTKEPLNRYQNLRQKLDLTSTLSPTLQIGSPSSPTMASQNDINQKLRRRTPFPIINQQERGVFDRIVDILIGDGPQHRFAMICKKCYSHNGMALKDDFEYTTFTCAFCNGLNPARKIRPVAPRLVLLRPPVAGPTSSDTSDSETDKDDSVIYHRNINSGCARRWGGTRLYCSRNNHDRISRMN